MFKRLNTPAILNLCLILLLLIARCMAAGWMLILFGLLLFFPVFIFHAIASTRAFLKYPLFSAKDKMLLWIGVLLIIAFTLFQKDMDDKGAYSVISVIKSHFSGKDVHYISDDKNPIYTTIPAISALALIVVDILLIVKVNRIKKRVVSSK